MYRHAGSICRRTVLVLLSTLVVLGVSRGSRTSPIRLNLKEEAPYPGGTSSSRSPSFLQKINYLAFSLVRKLRAHIGILPSYRRIFLSQSHLIRKALRPSLCCFHEDIDRKRSFSQVRYPHLRDRLLWPTLGRRFNLIKEKAASTVESKVGAQEGEGRGEPFLELG